MGKFEKIILALVLIVVAVGTSISYLETHELLKDFFKVEGHKSFFKGVYVKEDGLVEWLTVLALVFGAVLTFHRVVKLWSKRTKLFIIFTFILGLLFVFGAGEEISWGQRILKIKSPTFFIKHNSQGETNFHNLVVNKVKINKIFFGTILSICIVFYFLAIPVLYRRYEKIKRIIDHFAFPIPQNIHIYSYLILALLYFATDSSKKGELLEFGGCWIFFLMIYNPFNRHIYKSL